MWAPGLRDWETDVERWRLGMGIIDAGESLGGEEEGGDGKSTAGKWGESVREGDWEGTSERAVYTRAVKRRRERIPGIMWGIRRFIEEGGKAEGRGG